MGTILAGVFDPLSIMDPVYAIVCPATMNPTIEPEPVIPHLVLMWMHGTLLYSLISGVSFCLPREFDM